MEKDLFGNTIEKNKDAAEQELKNFDSNSFKERLERLKFINKIFPFGRREYGSDESYIIFNECIHCYVFGQFAATVILSQSFIERRFQEYYHFRMDKKSKYSLDRLLKEFKANGFIDDYFIEKINKIRLKRNPLVHHKDPNDENSLLRRTLDTKKHSLKILEEDAKDAINLMIIISKLKVF